MNRRRARNKQTLATTITLAWLAAATIWLWRQ